MKAITILRTTPWTGLLMPLVLGAQTALAEPIVYVPLGGENKIVPAQSQVRVSRDREHGFHRIVSMDFRRS
jgi:hypothetical protein